MKKNSLCRDFREIQYLLRKISVAVKQSKIKFILRACYCCHRISRLAANRVWPYCPPPYL